MIFKGKGPFSYLLVLDNIPGHNPSGKINITIGDINNSDMKIHGNTCIEPRKIAFVNLKIELFQKNLLATFIFSQNNTLRFNRNHLKLLKSLFFKK